jgi:hypothetical protein
MNLNLMAKQKALDEDASHPIVFEYQGSPRRRTRTSDVTIARAQFYLQVNYEESD